MAEQNNFRENRIISCKKELLRNCKLCPRNCGTDRLAGERGYCGQTAELTAARAALHMWEEPCISGNCGSGTVFFTGCALHCVFCQNGKIANGKLGKSLSVERLAEIFLELQEQGAANINLVTAGHFVLQVIAALDRAKAKGLHLPVVYNTSGYEKVENLRLLEGYVDIYLPDFKYWEPETAQNYSHAPDYPMYAKAAIAEMVRQTGAPVFEGDMLKRGTVVRHLLLPGHVREAKQIISYLHETYGNQIYISIMNQYTPMAGIETAGYPELARKVTSREYEKVLDHAINIGVENGFMQEGGTASESFIPDFECHGI